MTDAVASSVWAFRAQITSRGIDGGSGSDRPEQNLPMRPVLTD